MSKLELLLEAVKEKVAALFTGNFSVKEVFEFLVALAQAAEEIIDAPGKGADKHALVKEAWEYFNTEYDIIDTLDEAIKLPFWAEPFDGMALEKGVDLLITGVVSVLNLIGWGK